VNKAEEKAMGRMEKVGRKRVVVNGPLGK